MFRTRRVATWRPFACSGGITPLAYEWIERSVDLFQPRRSPLRSSYSSNLINPNSDEIVRCLSPVKERVLRQLVKDNARIEPRQANIRVEVRDTRRKRTCPRRSTHLPDSKYATEAFEFSLLSLGDIRHNSHAYEHLLQCHFSTRFLYVTCNLTFAELFERELNRTSEIVSAPPRGAPGSARFLLMAFMKLGSDKSLWRIRTTENSMKDYVRQWTVHLNSPTS